MKRGIILNTIDYKENDKIIYLLTPAGRESLFIKRAKKIGDGVQNDTQLLTLIEYENSGKSFLSAKDIDVIKRYDIIKNDLKKWAIASFLSEFLYRIDNNDLDNDRLYNMFIFFLDELEKREDIILLFIQIRLKLLYFLGIAPNFYRCCFCNNKKVVGFSVKSGSSVCYDHYQNDLLSLELLNTIIELYSDKEFKYRIINDDKINLLNDFINDYYLHHYNLELKASSIIKILKLN